MSTILPTRALYTLGVVALALVAIAASGSNAAILLGTEFCAVLAIALMWNLLAGFAGIVLIGIPVFIGVGGYALYLSANAAGWVPYPFVLAGALASVGLAYLLSPILFRLKDAQLAIGSWVLAEIARIVVLQSPALGAGGGLSLDVTRNVPRAMRLPLSYGVSAAVLMVTVVTIVVLMRSRFGLALRALRDSEVAAEAMGVDTARVRLQAFLIAAGFTGLAGATFYISNLQITPGSAFSLNWTAIVIFVVVLGGIGTIEGPILGAVVYFALRESLSGLGSMYFVIAGLLAIGVTIFVPGGLWGLLRRVTALDLLPITHAGQPARSTPANGDVA
jgi:branched-chain amino acid transport system permease protein